MTAFDDALARADGTVTLAELVPWAGSLQDEAGERHKELARELAEDRRIDAITITDNAGGHIRLGPLTLGKAIREMGGEVLVHLSCRDRSRGSLESVAYGLASEGLTNVLALSGDYPKEGYQGLSQPVFDIDSVGLLALLEHVSEEGPAFTAGVAVNPFKAVEADLVPQLLKLGLKVRTGARFAITQVGWDARSWDELIRWNRANGIEIPLIAAVYILNRGVARVFHRDAVPGIRLHDDLMALVEREAESPDKGRARFLELAAMQVAVARGLGYAGVYVAGMRDASELDHVLATADGFGPDEWQGLVQEVSFPESAATRLFESGHLPGLASDRPASRAKGRAAPIAYRINRALHDTIFEPGSAGFSLGGRIYAKLDSARLGGPAHMLEQAAKVPLFGCRDCGDCSLPDIAYLCPESRCAKNQRNGPCGGSLNGECEVPGMPCIWTSAYDRVKPYGEELTMLERGPVLQDHALRGTSAWANTFAGRDHHGRSSGPDEPDKGARS